MNQMELLLSFTLRDTHYHVQPVGEGGDLQEQCAGPTKANVMGTGLGGNSPGVK